MNKRIRELAEQAGFMVDQSGCIMVCFTSNGDSEVKKFAELIVRECAEVSFKHWERHKECSAHFSIREHFGVEE